jgi:hypothetical protein
MSSTESGLKSCRLLLNRFRPFNKQLRRSRIDLSLRAQSYQSSILAMFSLR